MTDAQILRRIGLNIRQAREAAGLTQEGLAELIDIHPKTMGYIESGKRDFGVTHLARISAFLGISSNILSNGIEVDMKRKRSLLGMIQRKRPIGRRVK